MNSCKQRMIEIGNKNEKNENKDRWNYCQHFPIFPLLGANHRLPILHMAKNILWVHDTSERINEFSIGYMINSTLRVNKAFKEKAENVRIKRLVHSHNLLFENLTKRITLF